MPEKIIFIYTTHPDLETAQKISRYLLEKKLIACANILPPIQSIYSWNGKIEDSKEIAVIFKTQKPLFPACQRAIETLHPYTTPCILQIDISDGNPAYLKWINEAIAPI